MNKVTSVSFVSPVSVLIALLRRQRPNGWVIYETRQVVVIATGFNEPSQNRKTGPMIQVWILVKAQNPVAAHMSGKQALVCFQCQFQKSTCYVNLGQAPLSVWEAWKAGSYPTLGSVGVFSDRVVRFGAFGEPTILPLPLLSRIASVSAGWTGYTHRWQNALLAGYSRFLMASVDDEEQQLQATKRGWRTFRVTEPGTTWKLRDECGCPAAVENGERTQCFRCKLCCGTSKSAKSVVIQKH